jgi:hypothetical protein
LVGTEILLDENKRGDFNYKELKEIATIIDQNKDILLAQLNLFYTYQPIKAIRK